MHNIPAYSALKKDIKDTDFVDFFPIKKSDLSPREIAEKLVMQMPAWFRALFALRNIIVKPFGLVSEQKNPNRIGFFPIIAENEREIVVGLDDKHLNFFIAVNSEGFGTWVRPHNLFGRIYLAVVMPFHKLICQYWQKKFNKQ